MNCFECKKEINAVSQLYYRACYDTTDIKLCSTCYDKSTFVCYDCGDVFYISEYTSTTNGAVCGACLNKSYIKCNNCHVFTDDSVLACGNVYCRKCIDDMYYYCVNCNGYYKQEHRHAIKPYTTNVLDDLNFMGRPKDGIYLGVELEIEVCNHDKDDVAAEFSAAFEDFAILKEDDSLDKGFEIVTAPADFETHEREWKERLSDSLIYKVKDKPRSCGLHIHVSRNRLSRLTIAKIANFMHSVYNTSEIQRIAKRTPNAYCERLDLDRFLNLDSIKEHHALLSLSNHYNTLEFRIFAGIPEINHVLTCMDFVVAVIDFAKNTSIKKLTFTDFIDFLAFRPYSYKYLNTVFDIRAYKKQSIAIKKLKNRQLYLPFR